MIYATQVTSVVYDASVAMKHILYLYYLNYNNI